MKRLKVFSKIILIVSVVLCVLVELYLHGSFQFYEKLDTVNGMEQLVNQLEATIEQGKETCKLYVENVSEEEIKTCNQKMDCFLGRLDKYTILADNHKGTQKMEFQLTYSENAAVLKAFQSGKAPSEEGRVKQLYDKVNEILASVIKSGMDDFAKEKAIHDYLVKNSEYMEKPKSKENDMYSAYGILISQRGVCNGYAEAMQLLLTVCDVKARMVIGTAKGQEHAWNMVCLDGEWYQVDTTWDDPVPDKKNQVQYDYFNVTDEIMEVNHVWEKSKYPVCSGKKYNYFTYYDKVCNSYEEFQNKVNQMISKKKKNISFLVKNYDANLYNMEFVVSVHTNVKNAKYSIVQSEIGTIVTIRVKY